NAILHTHLTGPISMNGTLLGVIVIDTDIYDIVDLFKDYTGLGWSGEALLARRDNNGDANFITPLRHHPESPPLSVTLPKENESAPITYALQGIEDTFSDTIDYDGIPVLAATKYIAELGWGIVVKIYVSEVMASIQDSTMTMIMTSFLSAGLFLTIGLVILRSLTEPMTKLTDITVKISDGDFSQRAAATSDDEISILAQSFNTMADTLINMNTELEKRVTNRTVELARSNADLEQFAYVISHDLQEPLRMIVSYLQLIETRYRDKIADEVNEFIDFAIDGAKRMKVMINDLLMYSRVGRKLGPTESVELMGIVSSVLANLRMMVDETNAIVEYENIPSVLANRAHMNMLFQNLISNAIKFRSEEPPIVRIKARHDGKYWIFSISDNGIGIDSDYYDRLFKVFQRLHPIGEYEGSGIGLAICKRVVENLGGEIWLESELNVGTTFYFSIPEGVIAQ
ncbi:MAG: HAMP domain-containing protein, partial [Candidatus Thorarchaeota archaeon]|nr:HAMP domain-containing protein [Candidatus Thorarchaeota archaeon]